MTVHVFKVIHTKDYDNIKRSPDQALKTITAKHGSKPWPTDKKGRSPDLIHVWFADVSDTVSADCQSHYLIF